MRTTAVWCVCALSVAGAWAKKPDVLEESYRHLRLATFAYVDKTVAVTWADDIEIRTAAIAVGLEPRIGLAPGTPVPFDFDAVPIGRGLETRVDVIGSALVEGRYTAFITPLRAIECPDRLPAPVHACAAPGDESRSECELDGECGRRSRVRCRGQQVRCDYGDLAIPGDCVTDYAEDAEGRQVALELRCLDREVPAVACLAVDVEEGDDGLRTDVTRKTLHCGSRSDRDGRALAPWGSR